MPVYRVIRKSDGEHVSGYASMQMGEGDWPFAEYDHVEYVEDAVPAVIATPAQWRIHVGPFFDRFGAFKIPILASTDPLVQALIKDATVRKYIDLHGRREELLQMIGILQSKKFAVDAVAILDVVPNAEEVYRGE